MSQRLNELSLSDESIEDTIQKAVNTTDKDMNESPFNASQSTAVNAINENREKRIVVRKSFTLKSKLNVIQWYKENGRNKSKTAKHFNLSFQNVF